MTSTRSRKYIQSKRNCVGSSLWIDNDELDEIAPTGRGVCFLNTSNEADSSRNSSSSSTLESTKSPPSTSTSESSGQAGSSLGKDSKFLAASNSGSTSTSSEKKKKQVKGNERNALDLKSVTGSKPEKSTKGREAPQDEKSAPILETKKGGHKEKQPVNRGKQKSKVYQQALPVAAEIPHDLIEEYSSSDEGSTIMDAIATAKEISRKAEKRVKEKKQKKKKRQKKDGAIETGLMLSRRTSYRISKSALSPHISPVSQSQTRLEFTPKTAT
eukprot:CAMPEP_0116029536 /NCGR_PEP_ID=MMETSP0321-20121206/16197_1 /TAXON_ID=163516 /ORGANISM="Leptocylindrus danicus var. danicus, Strain B650" /LENGTH=270 /DNA_ID=CAMNT_0003503929 /DNA_START=47 /DNA_END=859 /DNA_ORIENTATION=+